MVTATIIKVSHVIRLNPYCPSCGNLALTPSQKTSLAPPMLLALGIAQTARAQRLPKVGHAVCEKHRTTTLHVLICPHPACGERDAAKASCLRA